MSGHYPPGPMDGSGINDEPVTLVAECEHCQKWQHVDTIARGGLIRWTCDCGREHEHSLD